MVRRRGYRRGGGWKVVLQTREGEGSRKAGPVGGWERELRFLPFEDRAKGVYRDQTTKRAWKGDGEEGVYKLV